LSCHDGTIAFDALRNQPGSGAIIAGDATSAGWTFQNTGGGNTMPLGAITNLGEGTQDLSNDHPISMLYGNAMSPSASSGANTHANGFNQPDGANNPNGCGGTDLGDGSFSYPTTVDCFFTNGIKVTAGRVQCTSCHDPHRAGSPTFLRNDDTNPGNFQSQVCLTCHDKNT
jgi:predicted CXXCH cytochrome family protein